MAYHDQPAGDVIDAVAVLAPRDRMQGVLEQPAVVSEPFEMVEHRLVTAARRSHAADGHAATLAVISRPASSRY
jgi:hypothetical protein